MIGFCSNVVEGMSIIRYVFWGAVNGLTDLMIPQVLGRRATHFDWVALKSKFTK